MKRILLLLVTLISINVIQAQDKKDKNKKEAKKKYEEIITKDAESFEGLWYTHKLDGKHYFELPDSLQLAVRVLWQLSPQVCCLLIPALLCHTQTRHGLRRTTCR